MLEGIVARLMGHNNALIGDCVLNFYNLLESKSQLALSVVSANFYGSSLRSMLCAQAAIVAHPVIDFSENAMMYCFEQFTKMFLPRTA